MTAMIRSAWHERCRSATGFIREVCARSQVGAGTAPLARELRRELPDWSFREVLCRGGWYRLGGVVGSSGSRITDQLEQWASDALDERGGDLQTLIQDYVGSGLRATQITGRTHYLVANVGSGSTDVLQLEIESLQEVYAAPLFDRLERPSSLDELVDIRHGRCGACQHPDDRRCGAPLGVPIFRFRRLTHVGDTLARMRAQSLSALPIHRFFADWDASSAGRATVWCHHWVLALREHLDSYRQPVIRATPMAAVNGERPRLTAAEGLSGPALGQALTAHDRAVGYPMAWFFDLVAGKTVPHWVASSVVADARAGYAYLPESDLAVVHRWLHEPYGF